MIKNLKDPSKLFLFGSKKLRSILIPSVDISSEINKLTRSLLEVNKRNPIKVVK